MMLRALRKKRVRLSVEMLEARLTLNGTTELRIVAYNIAADIYSQGVTAAPQPAMETVLEGIGNEGVNGVARPIDILGLEETTSNALTVAPIVTALNAHYGAGTYVASSLQATATGGGDGDGPNALIYNSHTLKLLASAPIGTPTAAGYPRQPIRYEFEPVGGTSADDFYVYVSHYKSGDEFTDDNGLRRQAEAQAIRADEATLPATARVLYVGDYNIHYATDAGYEAITAPGQGQAMDPINSPYFYGSQAPRATRTESATSLTSRLDLQLVTQNVLTDPNGLHYVANSYHAFGNDGSVNNVGNSNTALAGLPNRVAVLNALTVVSDHLPIVADYIDTITDPVGPQIGTFSVSPTSVAAGANITLTAGNVSEHGAGAITSVSFYRESNGVAGLQVGSDVSVGTGVQNGANWTLTKSTSGLGGGVYTFYARATDSNALISDVVSTTLSVSGPAAPTIGSFTASPSPVTAGSLITLGAVNVVKTGGAISKVIFYHESNGVPGLQIGSDDALGIGTQGGSSWYLSSDTSGLAAGTQTYYAVASDTFGVNSATSSTTLQIIPTHVTDVLVNGTSWLSASLNGGYSIPVGSASQLRTLPWSTVDQIEVVFSEDVSVQQASLVLSGVNGPYAFENFNYNSATFIATWTLVAPISADRLHINVLSSGSAAVTSLAGSPLDGEWTDGVSTYPSGNGVAGGDFIFAFNVLPCDVNQDGVVDIQDTTAIANQWLSSGVTSDVNADGVVDIQDITDLANHWLQTLPTGGGGGGEADLNNGVAAAAVVTTGSVLIAPLALHATATLPIATIDAAAPTGAFVSARSLVPALAATTVSESTGLLAIDDLVLNRPFPQRLDRSLTSPSNAIAATLPLPPGQSKGRMSAEFRAGPKEPPTWLGAPPAEKLAALDSIIADEGYEPRLSIDSLSLIALVNVRRSHAKANTSS